MRPAGMAWWCGALVATGCFTGGFLTGRPCARDDECGPALRCEQGFCGGPQASTGGDETSGAPTTAGPTGGLTSGVTVTGVTMTGVTMTGVTVTGSTTGTGETTETASTTASDTGTDSTTLADPCVGATCRQIDLLFIVDDSPSIAQWQPQLLAGLKAFSAGPLGELLRNSCDVHLGVLATGEPYTANPHDCQDLGALVRVGAGDCGAAFATGDDDLADALACRLALGSTGDRDERPVQALLSALSPALNGPGGCNDGFLRPESLLVVVFATDEDDDADPEDEVAGAQTPGTPQAWFDAVVAFKGSAELVVMLALTGDLEPMTRCPWLPDAIDGTGAEAPDRLRQFIDLFPRRTTTSLCQAGYQDFVAGDATAVLQAGCEAHAQVTP